jgi:hypothetical protein
MSNGAYQTFVVYRTLGDESWVQVALKVYGAERFANVLMGANPAYAGIMFFDSSCVLIIPQLVSVQPVAQMPWNLTFQYS